MKHLMIAVLAAAAFSAVACKSQDQGTAYETADARTVSLAVSGMT